MEYQPVIGLEIHIELKTKTKMFCSCKNDPDEKRPNFNICPICMGHPGTLPVINKEAVLKTVKTGLALNCEIPEYSKFDRKNYFYPDLPKGYQISQYDAPLCINGYLKIDNKKIRIRRVHLEEDTGRLIHPVRDQRGRKEYRKKQVSNGVHEKGYSLVDFNRAGIPLMELVTEPDLRSAKEARRFAEELQLILRYLDVSDADMEKGQMRVEVNISLQREIPNSKSQIPKKLGTKVEIKNLNSFKAVEQAIEYEIERQTKILKSGKKVVQETRGWDENMRVTLSQREKEAAHDYRYFPEPDLPPIKWTQKEVEEIRATLPELPQERRERFERDYNLSEKEIEVFIQNKELGEYFEKIIDNLSSKFPQKEISNLIKLTSNYLISDLQGHLKGKKVSDKDFLITPENFAEFINLIYQGVISSKIAKILLPEMLKTGESPSQIIKKRDLLQITDVTKIEEIVKEVISKNQKAVSDYRDGKEAAFQFLIGQVMAKTKGKANPQLVQEILTRILSSLK